ncbi:BofC C-terminal domain-containing protein [Paenibacillus sp. CMAA1364]
MNASKLKKQLKRNWMKWKRRIGATALFLIISILALWGTQLSVKFKSLLHTEPPIAVETLQYIQNISTRIEPQQLNVDVKRLNESNIHPVVIRTNYICGNEVKVMGDMNKDEILKLMKEHPTWTIQFGVNEEVSLVESIEDLSPLCKQKAYISVDVNGHLSLYEGPPKEEKVLKTFFQLDINSMESALPDGVLDQLIEGIRIQDMDEYNSVISTFSDYAQSYSENVMKRSE